MSDEVSILDSLEINVTKLFEKMNDLEQRNKFLISELSLAIKSNQSQNATLMGLKKEIDDLKLSNSLIGGEDYKKETKLKINSLIRDIDYCIAQLAD